MLLTRSNISISSLCLSEEKSEQIKMPFFLSNSFCDEKPVGIDLRSSDGLKFKFSQDRFVPLMFRCSPLTLNPRLSMLELSTN